MKRSKRLFVLLATMIGLTTATQAQTSYSADDTHIKSNRANSNFSTEDLLVLMTQNSKIRHALLRFDLSNLAGQDISQAELWINVTPHTSDEIRVHDLAHSNWDPATVTWSTAPALNNQLAAANSEVSGWTVIDLSAHITQGGIIDLALDTPHAGTGFGVYSTESGNGPELRVIAGTRANIPPSFANDPIILPSTQYGQPFSASLLNEIIHPDIDPLSYTLSGPSWLSIDANATVSGTPQGSDLGLNTFTLEVADSETNVTATVEIQVFGNNYPPVFTSDPVVEINAVCNHPYLSSLAGAASDPELDELTFSLQNEPAWLTVIPEGLLSGTPTTSDAGLNEATLIVSDGSSTASALLQITVIDPPQNPVNHTNIVLIYIDDLGWMDLSCQGSEYYETPHIDKLASDGMRFTQGYTPYPRCLPARYGVITGRNPGRDGVPSGTPGQLLETTDTLADALKAGGYSTFFAGKWHLVNGDSFNLPHNQGFDTNIGGGSAGGPPNYFYPYRKDDQLQAQPYDGMGKDAFYHLGDINDYDGGARLGEYITDRLTDETIDWMRTHQTEPMFIYLSHYAVHGPYDEAPPSGLGTNPEFTALIEKYETKRRNMNYGNLPETRNAGVGIEKMRQDFPTYAAMIEKMDESVGRVMAELEALGLAENTLVIFTADNGGLSNAGGYNSRSLATSNYPLRTGKGWLYEGGIREAFIANWPGTIPSGVVNSNDVVNGTDLYPTFLDVAGLPLRPTEHVDGISIMPAMTNGVFTRTEPIIWHSPAGRPYSTGDFNGSAIRVGDYKLIDWYDSPDGVELFNLANDIEENHNLVDEMPELANELLTQLRDWRASTPGVITKTPEVSKPPQAWLDDPSIPASITTTNGLLDLSWANYVGYNYHVSYTTNLLQPNWIPLATDLTGTGPISDDLNKTQCFYKVELELLPEN